MPKNNTKVHIPSRWLYWLAALAYCGFSLLSLRAAAQEPLRPGELRIDGAQSYNLSPAFTTFSDPSRNLVLTDILQTTVQAQFKPVPQGGAASNFGVTHAAVWLRLDLISTTNTPAEWLIELANPPMDRIELFSPDGIGGFTQQVGGDSIALSKRPVVHRNHVMRVRLAPAAVTRLYLRLTTEGTLSAPITLWQPAALWQEDVRAHSLLSLYFGLLIGLLLYNLMLYFSVGDRAHLAYVGLLAWMGVSQSAYTGFGAQFLWPEWVWWTNVSPMAGTSGGGLFAIIFVRMFLHSARTMPRVDRLFKLLVAAWLIDFIAAFTPAYTAAGLAAIGLAGVSTAVLIGAGFVSIREHHSGAKYFFWAWLFFVAGALILALHNIGWLPSNPLVANALRIGSAIEMILLSFALGDRINTARRETDQALAQTAAQRDSVAALSESEAKYRRLLKERETILDNSLVGIAFLTPEGRLSWANQGMHNVLGAGSQALDSIERFYQSRAHYLEVGGAAIAALKRGENFEAELPMRQFDGTPIWVSMSGKAVHQGDLTQGSVWVWVNISRRKELEAQLARTAAERIEEQRALSDMRARFVSMTSHEFRTPLAAILSAQGLLRDYGDRLPARETAEMLGIIADSVRRMTGMLDRMLMIGQADAQMLTYEPRVLDLPSLCKKIMEEASMQQPHSTCVLELDYSDSAANGQGLYDEKLLRHIFSNLLSNAIKYSPMGGTVSFKVSTDASATLFEVTDAGIGIPPSEVAHLFESFHRASNVGTIAGTGLGLSIVKNAVEVHGGTINVHSEIDHGTRFTVRLPHA